MEKVLTLSLVNPYGLPGESNPWFGLGREELGKGIPRLITGVADTARSGSCIWGQWDRLVVQ